MSEITRLESIISADASKALTNLDALEKKLINIGNVLGTLTETSGLLGRIGKEVSRHEEETAGKKQKEIRRNNSPHIKNVKAEGEAELEARKQTQKAIERLTSIQNSSADNFSKDTYSGMDKTKLLRKQLMVSEQLAVKSAKFKTMIDQDPSSAGSKSAIKLAEDIGILQGKYDATTEALKRFKREISNPIESSPAKKLAPGYSGRKFDKSKHGYLMSDIMPTKESRKMMLDSIKDVNSFAKAMQWADSKNTFNTSSKAGFSAYKKFRDEASSTLETIIKKSQQAESAHASLAESIKGTSTSKLDQSLKNTSGADFNLFGGIESQFKGLETLGKKFGGIKGIVSSAASGLSGITGVLSNIGMSFGGLSAEIGKFSSMLQTPLDKTSQLGQALMSVPQPAVMATGAIIALGSEVAKLYIQFMTLSVQVPVKFLDGMTKFAKATSQPLKMMDQLKDKFLGIKKSGGINYSRLLGTLLLRRGISFVIRSLTSGMKEGIQNLSRYSSEFNSSMSSMVASLNYLKNAWGVAFSPIITTVAPIVSYFLDLLATALNAFGMFMSALTGKSFTVQAIKGVADYAGALDGAGNSASGANKQAKELQKTLLGFDQLNVLNSAPTDSGSGGGGGGGGGGGIDPNSMFTTVDTAGPIADWAKKMREAFQNEDWEGLGAIIADGLNKGMKKVYDVLSWENAGPKITKFVDAFSRTVNSIVDYFDWDLMGRTVGTGINTLVNTFNLLTDPKTGINSRKIGEGLGTALAGAIDEIKWKNLGNAIGNGIMFVWNGLAGFVEKMPKTEIGAAFGNTLNGAFQKVDFKTIATTLAGLMSKAATNVIEFWRTFDWKQAAKNIVEGLNTWIKKTDFKSVGTAISETLKSGIGMLKIMIQDIDRAELLKQLRIFVKSLDLGGISKDFSGLLGDLFSLAWQMAVTAFGDWLIGKGIDLFVNSLGPFFKALNTIIEKLTGDSIGDMVSNLVGDKIDLNLGITGGSTTNDSGKGGSGGSIPTPSTPKQPVTSGMSGMSSIPVTLKVTADTKPATEIIDKWKSVDSYWKKATNIGANTSEAEQTVNRYIPSDKTIKFNGNVDSAKDIVSRFVPQDKTLRFNGDYAPAQETLTKYTPSDKKIRFSGDTVPLAEAVNNFKTPDKKMPISADTTNANNTLNIYQPSVKTVSFKGDISQAQTTWDKFTLSSKTGKYFGDNSSASKTWSDFNLSSKTGKFLGDNSSASKTWSDFNLSNKTGKFYADNSNASNTWTNFKLADKTGKFYGDTSSAKTSWDNMSLSAKTGALKGNVNDYANYTWVNWNLAAKTGSLKGDRSSAESTWNNWSPKTKDADLKINVKLSSSTIKLSVKDGTASLALAAQGGILNTGQMFIAREAGPELVGTIGRKTAVANNNQITDSVANAVYRAIAPLFSALSGGSQGAPVIETNVIVDSETLFHMTEKGKRKANRRYSVEAFI